MTKQNYGISLNLIERYLDINIQANDKKVFRERTC